MHCNHFRCKLMFETHSLTAKAALHVQSSGKSVQGRSVCISVKVTVDFCCAVPFLISIATIVHSSLSPSISVSVPPPSLSHTQSLLCWERHKYDSSYWFPPLHFLFVRLCDSQDIAAAIKQSPAAAEAATLLSFYNVFKNLNVCNIAF